MNIEDPKGSKKNNPRPTHNQRPKTPFDPDELSSKVIDQLKDIEVTNREAIETAAHEIVDEISDLMKPVISRGQIAPVYNFEYNVIQQPLKPVAATAIPREEKKQTIVTKAIKPNTIPVQKPQAEIKKERDQQFRVAANLDRELKALKWVAKEQTQKNVLSSINDVGRSVRPLAGAIGKGLRALADESVGQNRKLATLHSDNLRVNRTNTPMSRELAKIETGITEAAKTNSAMSSTLSNQLKVLGEWYGFDREEAERRRLREIRGDTKNPGTARQTMNRMYRSIVPYGSTLDSTLATIKDVISDTIGGVQWLGTVLMKGLEPVAKLFRVPWLIELFKRGANGTKGGILGPLTTIVEFLWNMKYFVGGIAMILGGSAIYALFKTPGTLDRYITAFSDLWSKSIGPAFKYISDKVNEWWNSGGESVFLTIGNFVNDVLIYTIGTALPAILNTIGRGFIDTVELLKGIGSTVADLYNTSKTYLTEQFNTIFGFFGVGPYKDKGFVELIVKLFTNFHDMISSTVKGVNDMVNNIAVFIINSIDNLLTGLLDLLGLSTLFGEGPDTVFTKMGKLWNDFGAFVNSEIEKLSHSFTNLVLGTFNSIKNWIVQTVDKYNPLPMIEDKFMGIVKAIMSIFPSSEQLQAIIRKIIIATPGGQWLWDNVINPTPYVDDERRLDDSLKQIQIIRNVDKNILGSLEDIDNSVETVGDVYKKFLSKGKNSGNTTNVTIIQDNKQSSSNQTVVSGGSGGRPRGRPQTAPGDSGWHRRVRGAF